LKGSKHRRDSKAPAVRRGVHPAFLQSKREPTD
jgi:hypothetical protein